jgi:hypothetical protein
MNLLDKLTPKNIVLDALKSKLEPEGISKIVFIFNVLTDKYNIMLSKEDGGKLKLDLEEKEINMIKKMFIEKIKTKFSEESQSEIKNIIIELNLKESEFKVFIEDINEDVTKLDY